MSEQEASGIETDMVHPKHGTSSVTPLKPKPNTSLMRNRTLVPVVEHVLDVREGEEIILVTKVFAISSGANAGWRRPGKTLAERWLDSLRIGGISVTIQDFLSCQY